MNNEKVDETSMFSMLSKRPSSSSITSLPGSPSHSPTSAVNKFKYSQSFSFDPKKAATSGNEAGSEEKFSQTIAWSCAQIDCNCYIDESKVILPKDPVRYSSSGLAKRNSHSNTSFQPNKDRIGISVYSSKPKILFCNLTLRPNETNSCKTI